MKRINNILKELELIPYRYEKKGKITIIDTNKGRYCIKKNNSDIYDYLNYRTFNYYPTIITRNHEYEVMEYVEEIEIPDEQKILDLIDLVSLLHLKTTHYITITESDNKKIYDDILGNIQYLRDYYNNMMTNIEAEIYMSPSGYLLARNITIVFNNLRLCESKLKSWYKSVREQTKRRVVVLHNNLSLDHFINKKLISWNKSKIDIPIFDLYKLYKETYNKFEWDEILKKYMDNYPLKEEELELFYILILLPNKIEFGVSEYTNTLKITKELEYLVSSTKIS